MTTIVGKDAPLEQSIAHFQEILKNLKNSSSLCDSSGISKKMADFEKLFKKIMAAEELKKSEVKIKTPDKETGLIL